MRIIGMAGCCPFSTSHPPLGNQVSRIPNGNLVRIFYVFNVIFACYEVPSMMRFSVDHSREQHKEGRRKIQGKTKQRTHAHEA